MKFCFNVSAGCQIENIYIFLSLQVNIDTLTGQFTVYIHFPIEGKEVHTHIAFHKTKAYMIGFGHVRSFFCPFFLFRICFWFRIGLCFCICFSFSLGICFSFARLFYRFCFFRRFWGLGFLRNFF